MRNTAAQCRDHRLAACPLHRLLPGRCPPRTDRIAPEPTLDVLGQLLGRAVPPPGFFSSISGRLLPSPRHPRVELPGRLGRGASQLLQRIHHARPPNGVRRSEARRGSPPTRRHPPRSSRTRAVPDACSGAMYDGVPRIAPDWVNSRSPSTGLARPKSVNEGSPSASSRIFAGFRSRWRIPRWWAWWTASAVTPPRGGRAASAGVIVRDAWPGSPPRSASC